jgi:hypothetical protein
LHLNEKVRRRYHWFLFGIDSDYLCAFTEGR